MASAPRKMSEPILKTLMIVSERGSRPKWVLIPFLPSFVMEKMVHDKLHDAVPFCVQQLGLTFPCTVEIGLVGTAGMQVGWNSGEYWGPVHQNEIITRETLTSSDTQEIDNVLLKFLNEVFDATGHSRPPQLHHFPPGPPRL